MKFLENSKNFIDENTVFLTCFQKKKTGQKQQQKLQ